MITDESIAAHDMWAQRVMPIFTHSPRSARTASCPWAPPLLINNESTAAQDMWAQRVMMIVHALTAQCTNSFLPLGTSSSLLRMAEMGRLRAPGMEPVCG